MSGRRYASKFNSARDITPTTFEVTSGGYLTVCKQDITERRRFGAVARVGEKRPQRIEILGGIIAD